MQDKTALGLDIQSTVYLQATDAQNNGYNTALLNTLQRAPALSLSLRIILLLDHFASDRCGTSELNTQKSDTDICKIHRDSRGRDGSPHH